MAPSHLHSKILGGLWGALTGDALGVPVEFQSRPKVRTHPVTGMRGYGTHGQPAGTWSDDSSLLLCSAESLADRRTLDLEDLGERFVRWYRHAHWTPHGRVFDIGVATRKALVILEAGCPPELAGGADPYDNGNGSLMRILPVALAFAEAPAAILAERAQLASCVPHRHSRSQMACAYYCLFVRALLQGASPAEALASTNAALPGLFGEEPFRAERLNFQMLEDGRLAHRPEDEIKSSGYVLHTLTASVWCLLTSHSFEEIVLKAVNLGEDTDTTGTVAGGLAGVCYGLDAIPADWRRQLARHDDVAALFQTFLSTLPIAP